MTHVTVSEAKGGSVINDSVEKEIGSLAWPAYSPRGLGFRTPKERSSSGSPKKRAHIPPGSDALSLLRGIRWVGGAVGIQPVPIVATVQLHPSQERWDYFYKASESVPRQQSLLKTSAESTLKAEREERLANSFLFVTLLHHLHSSLRAQPYGLTSAKCVLKRREGPFYHPHSPTINPTATASSSSSPPLVPFFFFSAKVSLSVTCWQGGTVIITQAGFME